MAQLLYDPLFDIVDASGTPISGAKAYFYLTGTTTPEDTFTAEDLATPHTNPVIASSAGRFANIFLDTSKTYRCIIKDASDVTIRDIDPLNPAGTVGTAALQDEAVTEDKMADDSVPTRALKDGNVTLAKLADVVGPVLLGRASGTGAPEAVAGGHALNVLLGRVGNIFPHMSATAPTGALKLNGGTIGSASSGATSLAHADAAQLFAMIWAYDATAYPITDSAGGASTRGADAATDFAANKRLPLPNLRAEFIRGLDESRGVDVSRLIGTSQAEQLPAHTHTLPSARTDIGAGGQTVSSAAGAGQTSGSTGGTDNSSELRPRNVAFPYCCWY